MTDDASIRLLIQELGNDLSYVREASALCERAVARAVSSKEIRPVPDVAGSLAEYADSYVPLNTARESVWGGA